jgi:arginine decarboxylase
MKTRKEVDVSSEPREVGTSTSAAIQKIAELYGIDGWGAGYFTISRTGDLLVRPRPDDSRTASVMAIIDDLAQRGVRTPILLRFPQLIAGQVQRLHQSFRSATAEFGYQGRHFAVYPMKVNQRRPVVEAYLRAGYRYDYGLEVGSKAELYAAVALDQPPESLLVLNGFKDAEFVELAFLAARTGKNVVLVIEKLNELTHYLRRLARAEGPVPKLGLRAKLYTKGSGRWQESGGEAAKFGLTTTEILEVIRRCREHNALDSLVLLHFHIGSQLTDIKRIKAAVKEAARVYAKIYQMRVPIRYLDVGGGLAVDYDGSRTSFASSANYAMQEYANAVVYQVQLICDDENVPHPHIVTESGRVLTAYHAMLVTNVQDEIETVVEEVTPLALRPDDPQVIVELDDLNRNINVKNYVEYYHDALELRDELFTLFDLGLITLEQRAKGEVLFWDVCEKAERLARQSKHVREEFLELRRLLAARYLANFSVFRMLPDCWAIDQLFPVMPIHRLNEIPTEYATFCDLTCDSDGIVDRFVDRHDVKKTLEVHRLDGKEPYYIAFLLVGAYQEVMGSYHNLFGTPNEAHIIIDDRGYLIQNLVRGDTVADVLRLARYDVAELQANCQARLQEMQRSGLIDKATAEKLFARYCQLASLYTYLDPADSGTRG